MLLFRCLTSFAEEVDGVGQLRFLQLQLTLLDELQQLLVPQDGELRGNPGPLLQDPALQLHIAVWNQLAHHRLALDLPGRERRRGGEDTAEEERFDPLVCFLLP